MAEQVSTFRDEPLNDGHEWYPRCARCGGTVEWEQCDNCEDGYSHHDCGEDCCCCLDPENNVRCGICGGGGGWRECQNNYEWCRMNAMDGRELVERGEIEWCPTEGSQDE